MWISNQNVTQFIWFLANWRSVNNVVFPIAMENERRCNVTTGKCQLLPQLFLITAHFETAFLRSRFNPINIISICKLEFRCDTRSCFFSLSLSLVISHLSTLTSFSSVQTTEFYLNSFHLVHCVANLIPPTKPKLSSIRIAWSSIW